MNIQKASCKKYILIKQFLNEYTFTSCSLTLIIIKMKTTRELLTAADKLIAHSTLPWENRAITAHYAFSRALCICTHKIYKSKSTIPHPD